MKQPSWRSVLPVHPAAELFPLPPPDELKALGKDILANGLTSFIVLWRAHPKAQAQLLDGQSRLDAIELETGCPVIVGAPSIIAGDFLACDKVIVLDKSVDPLAYVISANLQRRHLSAKDKRDVIAGLIKARPEKSDRQIAEMVKASPTTVGTVRAEMETKGDVSKLDTRRDTKGRKQPASKRAKPAKAADPPSPPSNEVLQQRAAAAERIRAPMGRLKSTRDNIGRNSASEAERLRARVEELENENARLRRENVALHSEIDELKARLPTVPPPANDGLDIPEFLRRTAP